MNNNSAKHSQIENTEPDWEFLDWAAKTEEGWKKSLPRFTDTELLKIFPEAKIIILLKIQELKTESVNLINSIKRKFRAIQKQSAPENQWFWRKAVKHFDGQKLMEIQKHLMRLRRQLAITQYKKPKNGAITEELIQQARCVPLIDIANQRIKLRRSGKAFVGLCPFHNEKTPSFYIYPTNNNFYCYGCQKGGGAISFIMELEKNSFREAIKYLTR